MSGTGLLNRNDSLLRNRWYLLCIAIVTCTILLAGIFLWNSRGQPLSLGQTDATVEPWYRGPDNAPVTLDLYPDFLCSVCLEKERLAVRIAREYEGKVRLVYHHYPTSPLSGLIAEALEAAGEQGKFWELHDRLIDASENDIYEVVSSAINVGLDPEEYALSKIIDEAEAIGMDITRLVEAIGSNRFIEKVGTARQEAIAAGVTGASVFINGKEFGGASATYEDFHAAVVKELASSSGSSPEDY